MISRVIVRMLIGGAIALAGWVGAAEPTLIEVISITGEPELIDKIEEVAGDGSMEHDAFRERMAGLADEGRVEIHSSQGLEVRRLDHYARSYEFRRGEDWSGGLDIGGRFDYKNLESMSLHGGRIAMMRVDPDGKEVVDWVVGGRMEVAKVGWAPLARFDAAGKATTVLIGFRVHPIPDDVPAEMLTSIEACPDSPRLGVGVYWMDRSRVRRIDEMGEANARMAETVREKGEALYVGSLKYSDNDLVSVSWGAPPDGGPNEGSGFNLEMSASGDGAELILSSDDSDPNVFSSRVWNRSSGEAWTLHFAIGAEDRSTPAVAVAQPEGGGKTKKVPVFVFSVK